MKELKFKREKETIFVNGQYMEVEIATTNIIRNIIHQPKEGGYTIKDIRDRLKIIEYLDKVDENKLDSTYIDHDSYELIRNLAKTSKWDVVSKSVIYFINSLT
jgi:hypothetical protein